MAGYNNEAQQNVEDNLYIQRRRAVALGGDEEQQNFEENERVGDDEHALQQELAQELENLLELDDIWVPPVGDEPLFPEEQFDAGDLIGRLRRGGWVFPEEDMPIERQHIVEPEIWGPEPFPRYGDIAAEENDLLKDPNCSWGMLPISKGWTEDENFKQIRWSFPSDEMKMTELAFAKHCNARNIRFHGDWVSSQGYKNQQRAFFETFKNCNCCDRHNERFPQFGIARGLRINDTSLRLEHVGKGKSNTCVCACRHNARIVSDRAQFEAENW